MVLYLLRSVCLFFLLCILQGVWPVLSRAQAVDPGIRAVEDAAWLERRVQEDIDAARHPGAKPAEPEVDRQFPPEDLSGRGAVVFRVEKIEIAGNTVLPPYRLREIVSPYEGKDQSMQALGLLTRQITEEYRQKGYVAAQAFMPPQEIKDGTLKIVIVEGRVGKITFEGNRRYRTSRLMGYCLFYPQDILSYDAVSATVRRLSASDRLVRCILHKGTGAQETDVLFQVAEGNPLSVGYFLDNAGADATGKYRHGLTLNYRNLFGLDDTFSVGGMFGKEFGSGFVQERIPFASWGSALMLGASHSQSVPKKELADYGINSTSNTYWIKTDTILIDKSERSLNWKNSFEVKDSSTRLLSEPYRWERLRVFRTGPSWVFRGSTGTTVIEDELSFGIRGLGARIYSASTGDRAGVGPGFFHNRLRMERVQSVLWGTYLEAKALGFFSPDQLPAAEQLYLGGGETVRGYPDGDYLADKGYVLNLDYFVPLPFFPKSLRILGMGRALPSRLEWVLFVDDGYGRIQAPAAHQEKSRHLRGAGTGLRLRLGDRLSARLDWGRVLGDKALSKDDRDAFHFKAQAQF